MCRRTLLWADGPDNLRAGIRSVHIHARRKTAGMNDYPLGGETVVVEGIV